MKTTTYHIAARNSDNQWNWNGSTFEKSGRGDSTTFECPASEWALALEVFRTEFDPISDAVLKLVKVTFDDETEEFEDEEIERATA